MTISTYGTYIKETDTQLIRYFDVPEDWLRREVAKAGWSSLDVFLENYIWDSALSIYDKAKADGVIVYEYEEDYDDYNPLKRNLTKLLNLSEQILTIAYDTENNHLEFLAHEFKTTVDYMIEDYEEVM